MSDLKFRPAKGLEEKILAGSPVEGTLYFATDTGQIFLAENGEFIPMGGGGVSVLYANETDVKDNNNDTYTLSKSSLLDELVTPKEDDLIINSDGKFFKVSEYNELTEEILCTLIAVSGSGGGEGGGGTGGDSSNSIAVTYHSKNMAFLEGEKYYLELTATSQVDPTLVLNIKVHASDGSTEDLDPMTINSSEKVSVEVGSYMKVGTNAVTVNISGFTSNTYNKKINGIRMVSMSIETDLSEFSNYAVFNTTFQYFVKYYTSNTATLKVLIDGNVAGTKSVSPTSANGASTSVTINPSALNLSTGTHIITAYLEEAGGFKSNQAEIDFIYHPAGAENAVYIVLTSYPSSILSYEVPEVKYWVYDTSKEPGAENDITLSVNGVIMDQVSKVQLEGSENGLSWLVTGLEADIVNSCSIRVGQDVERSFEIYVERSEIFDPIQSSAVLLLSSEGRTNDTSLERRTKWEYTNYNEKTISTKFNDFNWENNGWKTDDEGKVCLRISNGANIEIPIRLFQDYSSAGTSGYTIEFEFKPYNLYSYESLSQITGIEYDEEGEVTKVNRAYNMDSASITYALDMGAESAGFGVGTQDTFFRMVSGDNVAAKYIENKVINVAIVLNTNNKQMLIYLDGVLSGMAKYTDGGSSAIPYGASLIKINSDFADIDLYSVRMYNRALTSTEVVQNYMASKKDLKLYQQNQLGAVDNTVSFADLVKYNKDNPENCTIPYIVFKTKSEPNVLPFNKDNDDIVVDITFTNVAADYKLKMSAKTDSDIREYLKHAPSFFAADVNLNVQGTSSQKYPRKNFKGKMLKKSTSTLICSNELVPEEQRSMSRLYLNPDAGEKTFTWKADYMDSSGKHNTGFTSFVKEVYNKHPLDYYFGTDGEYYDEYRTTIFGFPVLAFHENSKGEIQFIGRYNFNLDKSCEKSLGMTLEDKHPILSDKTIEEVAECWEFGNNKGGLCSFRYKDNFYEDLWNLIEDLEPRYHADGDAIENAFDKKDADGENSIPEEEAISIIKDKYKHLASVMDWVKESYCGFDLKNPADQVLAKEMMGLPEDHEDITENFVHPTEMITEKVLDKEGKDTGETITREKTYKDFVNERKNKFFTEFPKHFNEEYCLIYYVLTEVLVLFDSRGKNMMLASWGPQEQNGEYIWFPIFYDVDTQLGINNSGYPTMEYNVEPSNEGLFSTNNSLLWRSFGAAFPSQIRAKYREIRNGNFTEANINAYYDFDEEKSIAMKGVLPISIINADAFYKYILPSYAVSNGGGYVSGIDSSGKPIYKITSTYFYCVQGTRDLYRAQFLRNRFNYNDSMMLAGGYSGGLGGVSTLRWRVNAKNVADDTLDSAFIVNIMPVLDQYIIGYPDEINPETLLPYAVKAKGGETVQFDLRPFLSAESSEGQIINIPGGEFLQKFGDLSLLYLDEMEFPTNINEIILGNQNPLYTNERITKDFSFSAISDNRPLLKEFDITNLSAGVNINLVDSPKLEIFKALGTNIPSVVFADSPDLDQVYLPNTIQILKFNKASNLNKIIYNLENNSEKGLYIKDFIHHDENNNNVIRLNDINITGNGLHQYSYEFLEKAIQTKEQMQKITLTGAYTPYLGIQLKDVLWSPYRVIGEGAIYNAENAEKYKYANNNFTFSNYEYTTEEKWNLHIANGRIYEYIGSDVTPAKDLSLLDKLIENIYFVSEYKPGLGAEDMGDPYISGELYIDNDASNPISETAITNHYNKYFPDLKIKVANVTASNRVRFIQKHEPTMGQTEKEILVMRFDPSEYEDGDFAKALVLPQIPEIIHYDGYSDIWIYEDAELTKEEIINLVNDFKDETEYTFYTKYERHPYKITFHYDSDEPAYVKEVLYNDIVGTPNEIYPYKDASGLALDQCYKFEYYVGKADSSTKIDLDSLKATKDTEVWAYFKVMSVYDNVIDSKYIKINNNTIEYVADKEVILKGKITLPLIDGANMSINASLLQYSSGSKNTSKITHVFFENKNPQSVSFGTWSFNGMDGVQYIELPKNTDKLPQGVFNRINNIQYIGPKISDIAYKEITKPAIYLPNTITSIGENALELRNNIAQAVLGDSNNKWSITDINNISEKACGSAKYNKVIVYSDDDIDTALLGSIFNTSTVEKGN